MDPKTGFPTAQRPLPEKLWHFTADTLEPLKLRRIAAVMVVQDGDERPRCKVRTISPTTTEVRAKSVQGEVVVKIDLGVETYPPPPVLDLRYEPEQGGPEVFSVP
jgi:hypothetical protein